MAKSIVSFGLVLLIIALMCLTAAYGLDLGFVKIPSVMDEENGIRRGLDLVGGSVITFSAAKPEGMSMYDFEENMSVAEGMLRQRLTVLGFLEAQLYRSGSDRLVVEIPSIKNPEEAVQKLGSTAQLEFLDADGNVVLLGSDIKSADAAVGVIDSSNIQKNYVQLTLMPEAVSKFAEATKAAAKRAGEGKNYISISLDGEILSAPNVGSEYAEEGINSDTAVISGSFQPSDTKWLANIISAGQLPFTLKQVELRAVGPQLGERALETSLFAGLIGLVLVVLFMMLVYRLFGVMASIALCFYVSLVALILAGIKINLSLPGIAGIILSIGMSVDANVIIFERIKEELKSGKTIRSAVDSGFSRAFTAILDSNITTLIAAVVLYIFGTGPIVGFALTLGIGVMVSMFTAITVTHFLLNRLIGMKITSLKAYGV